MKSPIVKFAVVPALILLPVALFRLHLERTDPGSPLIKFVSVLVPTVVWVVLLAPLLLRRGSSLPQFLGTEAVFLALARLPTAAFYGLAWASKWTVEGTGAPVRYVADMQKAVNDGQMPANTSAIVVFLFTFGFPFVTGIVMGLLAWTIAWAVAFRGRRPYCSAPGAPPPPGAR